MNRCIMADCDSDNVWRPTFLFWYEGYDQGAHEPTEVMFSVPVCPAHQNQFIEQNKLEILEKVNDLNAKNGELPVSLQTMLVEWKNLAVSK